MGPDISYQALEAERQWEGQVVNAEFPLRRYLGGSSHGAVFLTDCAASETQKAAIKLIPVGSHEAGNRSETQLARWKLAAELSHPHLMRLFQAGRCEIGGVPLFYVVMEYADEDLSQILPQRPLSLGEAREMLEPVLDALAYLHGKGFAHGGIKPANIMAVGDCLKLASDRIVRADEPLDRTASPGPYDPPEAARGVISPAGNVSLAGDVWSVGVTLVQALTQTTPDWQWTSPGDPPLPPSLEPPFLEIARHCLCPEPLRRWSVAQIAAHLKEPASAAPPAASTPQAKPASKTPRQRRGYAIPAIGAALVVAAIFAGPRLFHRSPEVPATAQSSAEEPPAAGSAGGSAPAVVPTPDAGLPENLAAGSPVAAANPASGAVVEKVLPEVSQTARDTIQGTVRVVVRVGVSASGKVSSATFDFRGPSGYFADRAMQAAHRWKFAPAQAAAGNVDNEWLLRFEFTRTATNAFADPANR